MAVHLHSFHLEDYGEKVQVGVVMLLYKNMEPEGVIYE